MLYRLSRLLKKGTKGATAIEYALIASLIAVVAIAGMKLIGNKILNQLNNIADNLG
ncbi:MAG: Flp family type IVb pilin [Holosporaceae bacterium]|nr:Flp family type IVb pilin [Holosporaceae bacterium]